MAILGKGYPEIVFQGIVGAFFERFGGIERKVEVVTMEELEDFWDGGFVVDFFGI